MRYAPERKRIVDGGFNITLNFTIPTITVAHLFFVKITLVLVERIRETYVMFTLAAFIEIGKHRSDVCLSVRRNHTARCSGCLRRHSAAGHMWQRVAPYCASIVYCDVPFDATSNAEITIDWSVLSSILPGPSCLAGPIHDTVPPARIQDIFHLPGHFPTLPATTFADICPPSWLYP